MAKGGLILLLNNDIEVLESNWLKEMVSCFDYPETEIVGAKLLYPDRTIQHVGVIAGLGGFAGDWFIGRDESFPGPMGRLRVRLSLSVVTGACMLISRSCVEETGLFDEEVFDIAYNDVDYCLRALSRGFRIVWTPLRRSSIMSRRPAEATKRQNASNGFAGTSRVCRRDIEPANLKIGRSIPGIRKIILILFQSGSNGSPLRDNCRFHPSVLNETLRASRRYGGRDRVH